MSDRQIGRARGVILAAVLVTALAVSLWVHRHGSSPARQLYDQGLDAISRKDTAAATRDLEKAIYRDPRFTPAYELLSDCFLAEGRIYPALETLDRLRAVDPTHPHLATRLAETYLPADNLYALRWARQAVIAEPRSPRARVVMAAALARSGYVADALYEFAYAHHLWESPVLALKGPEAEGLQTNPPALAGLFRSILHEVPY